MRLTSTCAPASTPRSCCAARILPSSTPIGWARRAMRALHRRGQLTTEHVRRYGGGRARERRADHRLDVGDGERLVDVSKSAPGEEPLRDRGLNLRGDHDDANPGMIVAQSPQ